MKLELMIDNLFDSLDYWRHFPAYSLEPRADIFFSLYLPTLLEYKYGKEIDDIIPEFPIRIGTINPDDPNNNQSNNMDYLVKVKNQDVVFFVELKTDEKSRNLSQDWYLARAKEVGFIKLLEGLRNIYCATKKKFKYIFLFKKLNSLGIINFPDNNLFSIIGNHYLCKVVYIQPRIIDESENAISFFEAANIINQNEDYLSKRFAKSLFEWSRIQAGKK